MRINKKSLVMLNKTMFAIFLVLFVFFMFFTVIKTRIESKQEEVHFDQYDISNKFFMTLLSNSNCLSVGNEIAYEKFTTVQGILDNRKLNKYDKTNEDMWCVENFEFLYSVEVLDLENYKSWLIGITDTNPYWAERKISLSLPGIVRYEDGTAHLSQIVMHSYYGSVPSLIGEIKRACLLKKSESIELNIRYNLKYLADKNAFYIDSDRFYPYFSCGVDDFEIDEGEQLIYINYEDGRVSVLT